MPTTVDVPEKQVVLITEVQVKNDPTATIALSVVGSFLFLVLMSICMCWVSFYVFRRDCCCFRRYKNKPTIQIIN